MVLAIFNEGAYLSQSSMRPSIYFRSIVNSSSNRFLEPTSTTVSNKGKVSFSRKQRWPLMGNPGPPHYESDVHPTAPRPFDTGLVQILKSVIYFSSFYHTMRCAKWVDFYIFCASQSICFGFWLCFGKTDIKQTTTGLSAPDLAHS